MSLLNKNENQTDANFTAVEMADQPEPSSTKNPSDLFQSVVSSVRWYWDENGKVKLIITAIGILVSYMVVGILQERVMRGCYKNENGDCERFTFVPTLVGSQFVFAFTFVKVLDLITPEKRDKTNFLYYVAAAAANSSAMVCSNMALKWLTYPMQVIFKAIKPIAVMLCGLFICKRYPIKRYFFVLIIVIGVVVFKFFESDEGKQPNKTDNANKNATDTSDYRVYGIAFVLLSLLMDGVLGAIQDKIRQQYSPTSRHFMLGITSCGSAILITVVIVTGEIVKVYEFSKIHPEVLWHISTYAVANVVGQLFIYTMIASFGSLPCSLTTTMRKFFSVTFSIVFFGNPSTPLQWLGAILVFVGLLADAVFGKKHIPKPKPNATETELQPVNAENAEKLVEDVDKNPVTEKSTLKTGQDIV